MTTLKGIAVAVLSCACVLPTGACRAPPPPEVAEVRVPAVRFHDLPLGDVLANLARVARPSVALVACEDLLGQRVTLQTAKEESLRLVMEAAAAQVGGRVNAGGLGIGCGERMLPARAFGGVYDGGM